MQQTTMYIKIYSKKTSVKWNSMQFERQSWIQYNGLIQLGSNLQYLSNKNQIKGMEALIELDLGLDLIKNISSESNMRTHDRALTYRSEISKMHSTQWKLNRHPTPQSFKNVAWTPSVQAKNPVSWSILMISHRQVIKMTSK